MLMILIKMPRVFLSIDVQSEYQLFDSTIISLICCYCLSHMMYQTLQI